MELGIIIGILIGITIGIIMGIWMEFHIKIILRKICKSISKSEIYKYFPDPDSKPQCFYELNITKDKVRNKISIYFLNKQNKNDIIEHYYGAIFTYDYFEHLMIDYEVNRTDKETKYVYEYFYFKYSLLKPKKYFIRLFMNSKIIKNFLKKLDIPFNYINILTEKDVYRFICDIIYRHDPKNWLKKSNFCITSGLREPVLDSILEQYKIK